MTLTVNKFFAFILIFLAICIYSHNANADNQDNYVDNSHILTVYTRDIYLKKDGPSKYLEELFYNKYKGKIHWISVDRTVNIKKDIKRHANIDVVMGFSSIPMNSLVYDNNLLEIKNLNHLKTTIDPKHYNSKYYTPFESFQLSFLYNKNSITTIPKTLKELVTNPTYTIIMEDPATSSLGIDLLYWINALYQDQTSTFLHDLSEHVIFATDRNMAYNQFLLGNGDFVLDYSSRSSIARLTNDKSEIEALKFDEGNLEIHTYAGIDVNSVKRTLASNFISMLQSKNGQKIMSYKNYSYPVLTQDINLLSIMTEYKNTPIYINTEKFVKDIPILQQTWSNLNIRP